jgi:hypothetical protein
VVFAPALAGCSEFRFELELGVDTGVTERIEFMSLDGAALTAPVVRVYSSYDDAAADPPGFVVTVNGVELLRGLQAPGCAGGALPDDPPLLEEHQYLSFRVEAGQVRYTFALTCTNEARTYPIRGG